MVALKPCPFCGSKKVEICRTNEWSCWVRCARCGADAPGGKDRKEAIKIWNRRPKAEGQAKIISDLDKEFSEMEAEEKP
jgi:Lar family restriction alleviation protein